uniref:SPATA6 domain-containing protein n=1 Tax=Mesocestoides corti TaxID=53468 RepID=A0A5K3FA16_MESCO
MTTNNYLAAAELPNAFYCFSVWIPLNGSCQCVVIQFSGKGALVMLLVFFQLHSKKNTKPPRTLSLLDCFLSSHITQFRSDFPAVFRSSKLTADVDLTFPFSGLFHLPLETSELAQNPETSRQEEVPLRLHPIKLECIMGFSNKRQTNYLDSVLKPTYFCNHLSKYCTDDCPPANPACIDTSLRARQSIPV